MAAVVLAFEAHRLQPRPWQNHELAELYRAVDILGQAGLPVVTDMGVSDEGDPWFAFCRADTGDVIVHCARINGMFVASSIAIGQTFRGADFREVIDSIVRYQPLGLPVANTGSRLYLHPVMVLAAFVATALLCSKKADAHDLHSAVVALTPEHVPGTANKGGFQALKALLGPSTHVSDSLTKGQEIVVEFEPVSLATVMATAMIIIGPSLDAALIPVYTVDETATATATAFPVMRQADLVSIADSAHNAAVALPADTGSGGSGAATTAVASASPDLLPVAALTLQSNHLVAPTDNAPAPILAADTTVLLVTFVSDQHLVPYRTPERMVTTTTATGAAPTAAPMAEAVHQVDFTTLTPVAISILLGAPDAQPQSDDALTLVVHSPSHVTPVPPTVAVTTSSSNTTVDNSSPTVSLAAPAAPVTPASSVVVAATVQTDTTVSTAVAAPEHIVMGADPTAGLAALGTFAVTSHPLDGAAVASHVLSFAIGIYTAQIAQAAHLVVFDSNSVKLPFFEFAKGVLFVDDHELGITPSQGDLANAVTVDLASGGTMKLLGVVDTPHVTLTP